MPIYCFQSIVNAAFLPGELRENLAAAARNTKKLIQQDNVNLILSLARSIVSSDVVNEEELMKWKLFVDQWTPQLSILAEDDAALQEFNAAKEMLLLDKDEKLLDRWTKGKFQSLSHQHKKNINRRYIAFKFQARRMILGSTDSTGHLNFIVRYFNKFARSKPNVREQDFENLFKLLTLEGVELDEWLAIQSNM